MVAALDSFNKHREWMSNSDFNSQDDYLKLLSLYTSLYLVQTLISDKNTVEFNRLLHDKENFTSSIAILLLHGKQEGN